MEKILQPISSVEDIKAEAARNETKPAVLNEALRAAELSNTSGTTQSIPETDAGGPVNPAVTPLAQPTPDIPNPNTPKPIAPAASSQTYLTGSALAETKAPLPKGIYVIIGVSVISFVVNAWDPNSDNIFIGLTEAAGILVLAGLVLRYEVARKIAIAISICTVGLVIVGILTLMALQHRINVLADNYYAAVDKVPQSALSESSKQVLKTQWQDIEAKRKQASAAMRTTGISLAISGIVNGAEIIYLTRPKVRGVFVEIPK